ncbi:MAG: DUF5996 family protein [Alphaproteobacteria bacterium]|nr:DUF5996 family protein [Alphaproteobacteria bacterium]
MVTKRFPDLNSSAIGSTRDALHAYARLLGAWLKNCRPKRKHWWHASLRPSLNGLTTGVFSAGSDFEIELDLRGGALNARTAIGDEISERLRGQSAAELAAKLREFFSENGVEEGVFPVEVDESPDGYPDYSNEQANQIALALGAVASAMRRFRAGIREETSPIQIWPHHFDLSMLWLPGYKVAGQDPRDEESADKQMNFGFTFGDEGIPEPYLYVTAYPEPAGLSKHRLPVGTEWRSEGFSGAVLPYRSLVEQQDPEAYLLELWSSLLSAGRELMLDGTPAERTG